MTHGIMLIGCGAMAGVHSRALSTMPGVRLVCAVDIDAERAAGFKAQYGFERTGTDYRRELAAGGFDIVVVATHWPARFEIIKDCFAAGKHVLAEKPLSVYPDEVDALVEMARAAGLKLRVGMMERFRPMFLKIDELLRHGAIGRPLVYSFMHHQRPAGSALAEGWRYYKNLLRGGVTPNVDCGIHKCDLVRWFSGSDPDTVVSAGQKLEPDSPADNFTHSVFRMKDGSVLTLEDCYSTNTEAFIHMWILGDKGRIFFEYAGHHARPVRSSEEDCIIVWHSDRPHTETFHTPLTIKPVGPQMEMFIREIEEDRDLTWHYDNVKKATEMVVATVLSERRNEIVRFPLTAADREEVRRCIGR